MAKLTKSGLKSIVKECLVEILSEGLTAELSKKSTKKKRVAAQMQEEKRLTEHRQKFERRLEDTVSSITNDSVLQEVLRDTASTTLQEQLDDSSGLRDPNTASGVDLSDIFGESSSKWEHLAFENKK